MTVAREQGVLKLVHPKGRVELHKSPITAADVMRRNPRHCVTRPDVFKYPWIVVRPESVLKPGKVYFIVPNHTLRRLLKAKGLGVEGQQQHGHDHEPRGGYEQPRLSAEEVDSIYDQFHDKRDSPADELARFRQLVRKRSPHASSQHDKILKKPSPLNPKVNPMVKNPQETQKLNPCPVSDVAITKKGSSVHETLTLMEFGEEGGVFRETGNVSRLEPVTSKTRKPSPLNPKVNPIIKNLKDTHISPLEIQNLSLVQEKSNPRPATDAAAASEKDGPVHETHTFMGSREARLDYLASRLQNRSTKAHPFDVSTISPKSDSGHHVTELKSCLKKHKDNEDHERPRGPRVRFQIPVEGSKGLRFRVFHFQRVDTP